MDNFKPFEYHYVANQIISESEDFFRIIIQELCFHQILNLKLEWIKINHAEKKLRLRPFIGMGEKFNSYETDLSSEKFVRP